MNLPNHKQDLLDLKAQIDAKLKAFDRPVVSLEGETLINWYHGIPILPDDFLEGYEVQYLTRNTSFGPHHSWFSAERMRNWSAGDWAVVYKVKVRKIVAKEESVTVPVTFTTNVEGVTKFHPNYLYLVNLEGTLVSLTVKGSDIKYPRNIKSYRVLQIL